MWYKGGTTTSQQMTIKYFFLVGRLGGVTVYREAVCWEREGVDFLSRGPGSTGWDA